MNCAGGLCSDLQSGTVDRQCLGALHEVVLFHPELSGRIQSAVLEIDPARYKDSMAPLIRKDADALLQLIE